MALPTSRQGRLERSETERNRHRCLPETDAIHPDEGWGNGESDYDVMATGRRTDDLRNLYLCADLESTGDDWDRISGQPLGRRASTRAKRPEG